MHLTGGRQLPHVGRLAHEALERLEHVIALLGDGVRQAGVVREQVAKWGRV